MICTNCGVFQSLDSPFCSMCGTELIVPVKNNNTVTTVENEDPFLQKLYAFGSSKLFFIGILMYTIGTAIPLLLSFSFFTIFSIPIPAITIGAGWMIYHECTNRRSSSKILTALTMYKVILVILLVFMCIAAGFIGLALLIFAFMEPVIFIILLTLGAIFGLYIRFYYVSIFRAINCIRTGILRTTPLAQQLGFVRQYGLTARVSSPVHNITGATAFSVISYIFIVGGIIFTIVATFAMSYMLNTIPTSEPIDFFGEYIHLDDIFGTLTSSFSFLVPISTLFEVAGLIGNFLLILVFHKFAGAIAKLRFWTMPEPDTSIQI